MKVIFVDFDGVLNSSDWTREVLKTIGREARKVDDDQSDAQWILEPARIELLNQAVARTQAKVVVSSSWRGDGHGIAMLRFAGLLEEAIGETPHARKDLGLKAALTVETRAAEINAWLQQHPEVTAFVALDDEAIQDLPCLVRTQGKLGLQQGEVDEVVRRLNGV